MAVQRKVYRIEETARAGARGADSTEPASPQFDAYLSEIKALRELLETRAAVDREAMERARAQIAEAEAYRVELAAIYPAITDSRENAEALEAGVVREAKLARAGRELAAVVAATEQATQTILRAAEHIDELAGALCDMLAGAHQQGLAQDIRDRVVQIFEACNFQDLTGQRVGNVLATLRFVEERIGALMRSWRNVAQFQPVVLETKADDERRFLNGPRLDGDPDHSNQDEIDALFGCA